MLLLGRVIKEGIDVDNFDENQAYGCSSAREIMESRDTVITGLKGGGSCVNLDAFERCI